MKLEATLERFFFRRIGAGGFGLMRAVWAFVAGAFLLMQWQDVAFYYSDAGLITEGTSAFVMRGAYRLTVFDWAATPDVVFAVYLVTLIAMLLMMLGLWPRLTTALSVLLLLSFHERNQMVLNGGDTLLRNVGLLLLLTPVSGKVWTVRGLVSAKAPGIDRASRSGATMPIWPWRLLLWQMIVLYGTSLWYKLLGTMWRNGTAVEATFHHPVFARWPLEVMNRLLPIAGVADYLALFWQAAWLLLLVPRSWVDRLVPHRIPRIPLRRWLLLGGVVFHGGILLLLDAGVFPFAIFTAYVGLLREDDLAWLSKSTSSRIATTRPTLPEREDGPLAPFPVTRPD